MIDFHSHLLYGVDDGVKDREGSLKALEEYRALGIIRGIVFTPHIYNPYVKTNVKAIRTVFEDLQAVAEGMGIRTWLGAELFVRYQELKTIPAFGRFALCEFDVYNEPLGFADRIDRDLVEGQGLDVILAHVERYEWLEPGSAKARKLKERGYLFQVNASDVWPEEKKTTARWLASGMVDMFATDNHGRAPGLPEVLLRACERYPDVVSRMNEIENAVTA